MATCALRRPGEEGYWVNEDIVAMNVLRDGVQMQEGEGSLLLTSLYRKRYPIINYEIEDIAILSRRDGLDYIEKIVSRKNDVFEWKSGKMTTWTPLYNITKDLTDVTQIRFIQESYEKVTIQLVHSSRSKKTKDEIEKMLTKPLLDAFDDGVASNWDWVDDMPPEGKGKLRIMVSKIKKH